MLWIVGIRVSKDELVTARAGLAPLAYLTHPGEDFPPSARSPNV
jgi:hypothetical protein